MRPILMSLLALTAVGMLSVSELAPAPLAQAGGAALGPAQGDASMLEIERLGGFAGFGTGALRSKGRCRWADLSPDQQATVEGFFAAGTVALDEHARRTGDKKPGEADTFTYRITRQRDGRTETVDVPDPLMPAPLRECVRDTLE